MEPQVLWEDDSLLVIDKPAGWIVNRAETTQYQVTVQDWLAKRPPFSHFPPDDSDFFRRLGIVHRLDKETSGVLLIAKTPAAFSHLQAQFKSRQTQKTYTCLLHGKLVPSQGKIQAPVGRLPWNRKRHGILAGGRPATTLYQVENYFQDSTSNFYSLVSAFPRTGRTHQIRIHFKHLSHPLVGDALYAGRKTARADRAWCPRQFLHATSLTFSHPTTGQNLTIASPLTGDLKQALRLLTKLDTID